ncbi:hypothetical protein NVV93_18935 [Pseudomonas sp. LS44]|uniref:hypothetical protein n=1 Tax=Pseudomonas sp. LS44 TaxID=1357074 RepID=UPI00215B2E38|nr:hypothetical protein [Pseudomonas sp. LS44]UVE17616.1 hypothetical protein NVV93_18935 [Pseudomonas sp. LS44]
MRAVRAALSALQRVSYAVAPLASKLRPAAQDEAERLYLLHESHTSILRSARSQEPISRALGSLPARGCRP